MSLVFNLPIWNYGLYAAEITMLELLKLKISNSRYLQSFASMPVAVMSSTGIASSTALQQATAQKIL